MSAAELNCFSTLQHCALCSRLNELNVLDSPECHFVQKKTGFHACGKIGCWNKNKLCVYFERVREVHLDATLGNNVPHCQGNFNIRVLENESPVQTALLPLRADWWKFRNVVIEIEGDAFWMATASGLGCNCLIDTLRQVLNVSCNVEYIRQLLHTKHPALLEGHE